MGRCQVVGYNWMDGVEMILGWAFKGCSLRTWWIVIVIPVTPRIPTWYWAEEVAVEAEPIVMDHALTLL